MTDVIQTYPVAPSIVLSLMAVQLSERRYGGRLGPMGIIPRFRVTEAPDVWPVSKGYYEIIDRISRGEQP